MSVDLVDGECKMELAVDINFEEDSYLLKNLKVL